MPKAKSSLRVLENCLRTASQIPTHYSFFGRWQKLFLNNAGTHYWVTVISWWIGTKAYLGQMGAQDYVIFTTNMQRCRLLCGLKCLQWYLHIGAWCSITIAAIYLMHTYGNIKSCCVMDNVVNNSAELFLTMVSLWGVLICMPGCLYRFMLKWNSKKMVSDQLVFN